MSTFSLSIAALILSLIVSCGGSDSPAPQNRSEMQNLFQEKAVEHNIPYRVLLGIALKESNISIEPSRVLST